MSQIRGAVINLTPVTTAGTGTGTQIFQWGSGPFDNANFFLNVTTATGMTTLDVYIQTSWNSGTTWTDFLHFGQVGASASSIQVAQWARKAQPVSSITATIATGDANLAASKVVGGPVVDSQLRVKWVIAATTSYTFQVFAIADRDV